MKKGTPKARAFNAEYRENSEAIATYLNEALATGDPVLATKAIGGMIRAQGMTKVAQKGEGVAIVSTECLEANRV